MCESIEQIASLQPSLEKQISEAAEKANIDGLDGAEEHREDVGQLHARLLRKMLCECAYPVVDKPGVMPTLKIFEGHSKEILKAKDEDEISQKYDEFEKDAGLVNQLKTSLSDSLKLFKKVTKAAKGKQFAAETQAAMQSAQQASVKARERTQKAARLHHTRRNTLAYDFHWAENGHPPFQMFQSDDDLKKDLEDPSGSR